MYRGGWNRPIGRRELLRGAGASLLGLAAAATIGCSSNGEKGSSGSSSKDPIRLGILASYSGVFALYGPNIIEPAVRLFLDLNGGQIAGRPVELFIEDDRSDPTGHVEKVTKLVEDDKIHALLGVNHSGGILAIRDYLDENKVPTFVTVAGAKDVTQSRRSEYIFRTGFANGQMEAAGAILAWEHVKLNRVVGIGADYTAGHELLEPLLDGFRKVGGTVVETLWHPLGTADFSTYLSRIQSYRGQVDAVVPLMFGADATRFFAQYKEFGVGIPLYCFGNVLEQTAALDSIGAQAVGVKTYWMYSSVLNNEENSRFRTAYRRAYGRLPGAFSATTYAAMQALAAAAEQVDGNVEDKKAFVRAVEQVQVESPFGPLSFDADHGVVLNVYLNEVRDLGNGVITQVAMGPVVTDVRQTAGVDELRSKVTVRDNISVSTP